MIEEGAHEIGRGAPFSDLIQLKNRCNIKIEGQHDRGRGAL
jgi:hypothetical protein